MQQQIQTRLEVLKKEFETGQAKLRELEMQQSHLRETLLRISGAIQVLEEMIQPAKPNEEPAPHGSSSAEPSGVGKG
jgi:predicted nuclease with TOPRIM domain